jgi:hypothetical protein
VNRNAKVLCGQLEISWDDLVAALMVWKKDPDVAPLHQRTFLKAMHLAEFRDRFSFKGEPISLLNAMHWSYQTIATDSRDKIFGLLGLCHDGDTLVPIRNYKQPFEEVIMDMSKRMMTFKNSLDLTCFRGTSLSTNNLPSWTPNFWSGPFHSMAIHEMKFLDSHNIFPFDPVLGESTNQVLKVKGKKSGQVLRLTSELAQPDSDGRLSLSIDSSAHWILSTPSPTERQLALHNSGEGELKIRDSIWQTLTMDLLPTKLNAKAALFFSKLWMPEGRGAVHNLALIDWIDRNASLPYRNWTLREWSQMKAPSPSLSASSNVQRWKFLGTSRHQSHSQRTVETQKPEYTVEQLITFIDTIERVLKSGMRLAVVSGYGMSDGDYIGMVHLCTRTSDEVWHIRGCSVPVVLREIQENRYKVVGAMYLHDAKTRFVHEERWIWGKTGDNAVFPGPVDLNLS